jgi:hypothetical protein
MKRRTLLIFLLMSLVAVVGCQPKNSKKTGISRARIRGLGDSANAPGVSGSKTTWGEINVDTSAGQTVTTFWNELYYLTYPQLISAPSDEQLGYVDGSAGQHSTGVRFWGHAKMVNGSALDASSAEIDIEIYDDRVGMQSSLGDTRPAIKIHISPKIEGFVSVSGSATDMVFQDSLGQIRLSGSFVGDYFQGKIYYTNSLTGLNSFRQLGSFKVKKTGFFE